jgi:hypothetical protein
MKYTQKTKYFIYGVIATAVLVPLGTYAVKTIPVTFSEGDVLSASVLNSLMERINDTQQGFTASTDIVGTWSCTTYSAQGSCTPAFSTTGGGVLDKATQNITFSCASGSCSYTAASFWPANCQANGVPTTQAYELNSNMMATSIGVNSVHKINPNKFFWNVVSSLPPLTYVVCEKNNQAPAPADALSATVSGTSVALAWTDQSTDETGFKVQYKTSSKGTWTTATTTAASAVSYTLSGLTAGTYWIRVVATNSNGDAMSSSEVQGVIQ